MNLVISYRGSDDAYFHIVTDEIFDLILKECEIDLGFPDKHLYKDDEGNFKDGVMFHSTQWHVPENVDWPPIKRVLTLPLL